MSLKDLTVVVVTYSRQRYVDRQVAYWAELGANLLILDGSPQAHPNRLQWEAFPNVVYVHSTTTYDVIAHVCSCCAFATVESSADAGHTAVFFWGAWARCCSSEAELMHITRVMTSI